MSSDVRNQLTIHKKIIVSCRNWSIFSKTLVTYMMNILEKIMIFVVNAVIIYNLMISL